VILWDIQSGKELTSWEMGEHVNTLSFSADNQYLYVGTYTKVMVYNVATKTKAFEISHRASWGAEYLEGRNKILMVSNDGEIQLGVAPTGKQLWHYQAGQRVEDWNHYPQEDLLAIRLSNGEIVVLDLENGQVRLRFHPFFKVIGPLNVSKDGKRLAVAIYSDKEEKWGIALWQLPEKVSSGEGK
jgi:WD40 repeat protein